MMAELLGDHELIAQDLFKRVKALSVGDYEGPNLVLIRGASGVGKTAIVQRLYELLGADLTDGSPREYGQYWPELFPAIDTNDPLRDRALLTPELGTFLWRENTLPTFGWWGFNCAQLRNNQRLDVVSAGKEQMALHMGPLTLAWWNASGTLARTGKVLSQIVPRVRKDLQSNGSDLLLEAAVEAINIGVPLPGTLTSWLFDVLRWLGKKRQESKDLHRDVDLGVQHLASKKDAGAELAKAIRSLTAPGLPGIVVIEDMHLMGPELRSLLLTLSEPDSKKPVLVIGTAWPEGMAEKEFSEWYQNALDGIEGGSRILEVEVNALDQKSLVELLLRYAPETEVEVARQVVAKLNTPLFLLLWITDPNVALEIQLSGNRITLSDNFKLPGSVEQVIGNRWEAMPADVRNALTTAVASNPSDPDIDMLNRFVPTVIAEVVRDIYQTNEESARAAFEKARNPIGWCQGSKDVARFADELLTRHVRKSIQNTPTIRERAQEIAYQACRRWLDRQREGIDLPNKPQVDAVVDWYLAFAGDDESLTTAAAHTHAGSRFVAAYDFAAAIECFNRALKSLGNHGYPRESVLLWRRIADCHYSMSEFSDAEALLLKVLPLQTELDGPNHPETLAVQVLRAKLLLRSGDPLEAIPLLNYIKASLDDYYADGSVPANVIESVYIPAFTLMGDVAFESQAHDDAIDLYQEAIRLATIIDDGEFTRTLMLKLRQLRPRHANNPTNPTAYAAAVEMLAKLKELNSGELLVVFEAEANILFWGYQSGQIRDIEEAFQDLDQKMPRARIYETLRADMYVWAGDIAINEQRFNDAKEWYSSCLSILDKRHGPYDPLHLRVTHQLGIALLRLNLLDEATRVVEELTENAKIAVGSTGMATVEAEVLLSIIYQAQGRAPEAFSRLSNVRRSLVADPETDEGSVELVESRLRELNGGGEIREFYPLIQMKIGRFGRLSGSGSASEPLWAIENDRPFAPIENQMIVINNTERMLESSPNYWARHLDVLSRAYMNLGACYWRTGNIEAADEALGTAANFVRVFFSQAYKTGDIPSDFELTQMAARNVAISINILGMIVSLDLVQEMHEVYQTHRERASGLLSQLSQENAEDLGEVDVDFLKQELFSLLGE